MKYKKFVGKQEITAEEIKILRKKLKLTQKEFAGLLNCSKPTIERWETSKEPVKGPAAVAMSLLNRQPEYVREIQIPEKKEPIRLWYMYQQMLCTLIEVNEAKRKVEIKNYTNKPIFRAFGVIDNPDFKAYEEFLESRCFPRTRDKMKLVLKDLDLPFYDPFLIIEKTEGRMAEDEFWIQIER